MNISMKLIISLIAQFGVFSLVNAGSTCGHSAVKPDLSHDSTQAVPYSWPWHVAVMKFSMESGWSHQCSGSLISDQWILSAGTCIADDPHVRKYQIKLGVHNKLNNMEDSLEMIASIAGIHANPNSNAVLLKLSNPIKFNDHVYPVCMPSVIMTPGSQAVVTGWSLKSKNTPILKQSIITITDMDECKMDYPNRIRPDMFCASKNGLDPCEGDIGSPLVYFDRNDQKWMQFGIASWSECGKIGKPGIYTKVAILTDWIKNVIGDHVM